MQEINSLFASLLDQEKKLLKEFQELHIEIILSEDSGYLATLQVASPLVDRINKQYGEEPS